MACCYGYSTNRMQAVGSQRKRKAERCQERELEYWDRDIIKIRRENRILSDISNSQADPVKRIGQVYQPITINVILENVLLWS